MYNLSSQTSLLPYSIYQILYVVLLQQ